MCPQIILSNYISLYTLKNAVTPGKVDILEDAKSLRFFIRSFHYLNSFNALSSQLYNFTRKYFANVSCTNTQKSARFRRNYPTFCFIVIVIRFVTCCNLFHVIYIRIKKLLLKYFYYYLNIYLNCRSAQSSLNKEVDFHKGLVHHKFYPFALSLRNTIMVPVA